MRWINGSVRSGLIGWLRLWQGPGGRRDVEAVADEVAAGAFDDAGRDRPSSGHHLVVAEELCAVGQVADAGVDAISQVGGQVRRLGVEIGDDLACVSGQQGLGVDVGGPPVLGRGIGWSV